MTRSHRLFLCVAACLLAAVGTAGATRAQTQAAQAVVSDPDDPWSGTWSDEALFQVGQKLVRVHIARGPQAGAAALERALGEAGSDHAERARIAYAYAVGLTGEAVDYLEALPAMEIAVSEARLGLPRGRRLAMILGDAAILEIEARGAAASPEAEARALEAWEIRTEFAGRGSMETLAAAMALADLRGRPERRGSDAQAIDDVDRLYAELLHADSPTDPDDDLSRWFVAWGRFSVESGRPDRACAVLDAAMERRERLRLDAGFIGYEIGRALESAGHRDRAAPLLADDAYPFAAGDAAPRRCA